MAEVEWAFAVGGISLSLAGPTAWVEPFARAWAPWADELSGWTVRLVQDETLPAPQGPFFGARPRFVDGHCRLEAQGFAGEIAPENGAAHLRAHPVAEPGDLAYFVRTVFALRSFDAGALLFHAAGVVHQNVAYALFGHSGSGKTTASRLSSGKPVLSDDLVLLRQADSGWETWATPFGRQRLSEVRSAPLRALLRLVQAPEERLEPMPRGAALGELVANSPVINADPTRSTALLARWEGVLRSVPTYFLHFRKSDTFWEVIDAQLE
ncbi:MAG: hypothetical protein JXA14_13630 [Anaerolineae bacterium]|nr:hypothetical protein [Anaerolineae bacterium]